MRTAAITGLLCVTMIAMLADLKTGKIPNGLIAAGVAMGVCFQVLSERVAGILVFAGGLLLPLLLMGGLFYFRMAGAGDIKLLCALGGIMGPRTVMECIVYSLLAGAGISLAILISTGGIRRRFLYLYQYMNEFYCTGEIRPYYRKGMSFPENFHFTVPIFLSAVLYVGGVY